MHYPSEHGRLVVPLIGIVADEERTFLDGNPNPTGELVDVLAFFKTGPNVDNQREMVKEIILCVAREVRFLLNCATLLLPHLIGAKLEFVFSVTTGARISVSNC